MGRSLVRGRILLALSFVAAAALIALAVVWAAGCGDPGAEARELEERGDWSGAIAVYERMLANDPEDLRALTGIAVALMVLHRFDDALEYQERVVLADPLDAQTRVELGFNYLGHQNRADDAVRVLGEAVELQPSAKNMTFLAQAQEATGDRAAAEATLRRAIEADPEYPYAYSQLASLLAEAGRGDEAEQVIDDARARGVKID